VLLATKLHVPGPRAGFVPRPRLARRLDEGADWGLVLVCPPAGVGKTALLADWARSGQRAAACLSLDDADNDPARFWRHAVAALDRACQGTGERVGPLLGPPLLREWLGTAVTHMYLSCSHLGGIAALMPTVQAVHAAVTRCAGAALGD